MQSREALTGLAQSMRISKGGLEDFCCGTGLYMPLSCPCLALSAETLLETKPGHSHVMCMFACIPA